MTLKQTKSYQKVAAAAATPVGQVAILLEHCALLLTDAIKAIENNEYETRFNKIDKVMVILATIDKSLDTQSSQNAVKLSKLFRTMCDRLTDVNFNNDAELCKKVLRYMHDMAKIWRAADKQNKVAEYAVVTASTPTPSESTRDNVELSI